jgi:hypothetical protein
MIGARAEPHAPSAGRSETMSRVCFLIVVLLAIEAPEVCSQNSRTGALFNLYAREALTQRNICTSGSPITQGIPCEDFRSGPVPLNTPYYVYLVAASQYPNEIAGFVCGIRYDPAIAVLDWTLCADYESSLDGWPVSGSGNGFAWDPVANCQTTWLGRYGAHAVAGAFYVIAYGDGVLEVTPHYKTPPNYELTLTDCDRRVWDGSVRGGALGFGSKCGFSTCVDVFWMCLSGYEYRRCCCAPGSAQEVSPLSVLEQTCVFTGGKLVNGLCDLDCEEICAQSVATERQTWGRIKTRFK